MYLPSWLRPLTDKNRGFANWKFINEVNYRIRYFYRAIANV